MRHRILLALEGGGAKGIVHLGVLRFLEEQAKEAGHRSGPLDIMGFAGTSAGAIVAALAAAGYRSDELLSEDGSSPLLELLGLREATDLFGRHGWFRLHFIRRYWPWILLALGLWLLVVAPVSWWLHPACGLAASVLGAVVPILLASKAIRGIVGSEDFTCALDMALRHKLGEGARCRPRFRDLPKPLRIIATDVVKRRLKLFSDATTPDIAVSDAVAASTALPLVFRPYAIGNEWFWDGGLVSNLPAWTFDEDRSIDPDSVTLAVEIPDEAAVADRGTTSWLEDRAQHLLMHFGLRRKNSRNSAPLSAYFLVRSLIRSALFGARVLNIRGANRLVVCKLPTQIGILQFDMSRKQAAGAVADAARFARAEIGFQLFDLPAQLETICKNVHDLFDKMLQDRAVALGAPVQNGRVRVNLAIPDPDTGKTLRIRYGYNLEGDPDNDLVLPLEGSITGEAFRTGETVLYETPFPEHLSFPGRSHRHRRALVWTRMKWCLAMPIYANDSGVAAAAGEARPAMALNVDSDIDVRLFGWPEMTEQQRQELVRAVSATAQPAAKAYASSGRRYDG